MNVLEKLGIILLRPKRAFEIIAIEEQNPIETILLTIPIFLTITSITLIMGNDAESSVVSGAMFVVAWIGIAVIFAGVVKAIYKLPGSAIQFLSLALYTQVSLVLPIIATFIYVLAPNLITMSILVASGVAWFIWDVILAFFAAKAYFRIDAKQFLVALLATLTISFTVVAILGLMYALIWVRLL